MSNFLNKYLFSRLKKWRLNRVIQHEGGQAYSQTLRRKFSKEYNIEVGYGTYGGCFNRRNINDSVIFGNYCSIAQNIRIFRANHPKNYFTTHPLFYNPAMGYVDADKLDRPKLIIGHDVWIGEWVIILPKVAKIGNGAIIGAGSVVTKDVLPYSIVAGNPAKVIGKRFSPEIIEKLEHTCWWNWNKETLIRRKETLENIINEK